MKWIKLVACYDSLRYPDEVLNQYGEGGMAIVYVYPEGDCDGIKWPKPNMKKLRSALYDDRETGLFNDDDIILLPNGERVNID